MKIQSNDNRGMMVSVGNQSAVMQRTKANKTKVFSAVFLFGESKTGLISFSCWLSHQVTVTGWFNIQQMENRLREIGCNVEPLKAIKGTFFTVS